MNQAANIKPIMLWMTSRSRSSMVSKIFAKHGVFWGDTQSQSAGYDTYENQTVKAMQKAIFGGLRREDPINENDPVDFFLTQLEKVTPKDKIWSVKTGVEFLNAFQPLNPYHIYITRTPEDVANSVVKKVPGATYDDALKTVKWRLAYMQECQEKHGGIFVSTDKIIDGDFSEIKEAIEYCGLEFSQEAAERAIKR